MTKQYEHTKIEVEKRGAPVLTNYETATIIQRGEGIVALYIDLTSKHCELDASFGGNDGSVGICIGTTEHSLHLDETKDKDDLTLITFPEFKGWTFWCGNIARYTCSVCLVKEV